MKIGVYGGTFDPIHIAHLVIAEHAREQLGIDIVLFIPSYVPPHKKEVPVSSPQDRLKMVDLATRDNPHFQTIDFEIKQKGKSYTLYTLQHISEVFNVKRHELFLFLGADNYINFHKWKAPEAIYDMCRLAVADRPDISVEQIPHQFDKVEWVYAPKIQISSSAIRNRRLNHQSIRYLLPNTVKEYIEYKNLYKS